jgi:RNA recognition motif-containing protein
VRGKDYDQDEEINISTSNNNKANSTQYCPLAPAAMEEVQDLIEDVRDMYEEADNYLFQSHATWAEGKVCFWKHRSLTEAYVLGPIALGLRNALGIDDVTNELADKETLKCFEKLVKTQKPCHPDSWREYLRYVSTSHLHFLGDESSQSKPDDVGAVPVNIRQTRALYKRAMSSIRKAGKSISAAENRGFDISIHKTLLQRDYDVALSDLCHEYLEFEHFFGSEESLSAALTLVRSKMANYDATTSLLNVTVPPSEESGKRKLETDELTSTMKEDQMYDDDNSEEDVGESRSKRTKVKINLKEPKKTDSVHKVRIGKIDYPAHPFTIHVSNLDKDTQDMDLVDAFRPLCGAIVHAKIIREKFYGKGGHHSHGESKGAGLVQFEERMAVEKALEKNGELEIGGKVVKIHRSHMPAVGMVPQGMHRVSPKGEGKVSKRNQVKKKSKGDGDGNVSMECDDTGNGTAMTLGARGDKSLVEGESDGARTKMKSTSRTSSSPGSLKLDALSFKPRVIKQKPKISLGNFTKK